jgi:hypothetical protein
MRCPACGSRSIRERPERTTQGYRRFRCRCGKQFNERSAGVLNKAQYPSDVIALVVLWRLRYKLSLRDLAEMFLTRAMPRRIAQLPSLPIPDAPTRSCRHAALAAYAQDGDRAAPIGDRLSPATTGQKSRKMSGAKSDRTPAPDR